MIAALRRGHRRAVVVGWMVLPPLVLLAFFARPVPLRSVLPSTLIESSPDPSQEWFHSSGLFEEVPLDTKISTTTDGVSVLSLRARSPLSFPQLLVYWRPELAPGSESSSVEGADLLGILSGRGAHRLLFPSLWKGGGQVILYSVGRAEVVASSSVLPFPAPEGRP